MARTSMLHVCVRASVCVHACGGGGGEDVNVFGIFRHWLVGALRYDPRAWGITNFHHQSLTIGLLFERKKCLRALRDVKFQMRMLSHPEGTGIWLIGALRSHASPEPSLFAYAISHEFDPHERIYCNPTNDVNSAPLLDLTTRNHCTILPKAPFPWIHWAVKQRIVYGGGNPGNLSYSTQAHAL